MKNIQLLVLVVLSTTAQNGESARILAVISTPSYSHQIFFQMVWRELALRGHEVVVLTTEPSHENIKNLKEIDMSSATPIWRAALRDVIELNDNKAAAIIRFVKVFHETAEYEFGLPEFQKLIKNPNEHFDLVMVEAVYPAFFVLKQRFNCSLIAITSMEGIRLLHNLMGNPIHSVLYPNQLLGIVDEMSFRDRVVSFLVDQVTSLVNFKINKELNDLTLKYFGEGYISYQLTPIDMFFINDNPMFVGTRPLLPGTVSIAGGIHIKALKELPEDLKTYMDASTHGVIYFSMGSNVKCKDLPQATLQTIMKTFSQLPYNVLWKFDDDDLPGKPDNVKIIKWAPQQDLLRHKNMKLFITQAGMQSLEEALFSHIPLITIPLMGDQDSNAARVAFKELGVNMNYKTMTVEEFRANILEVITNPKYKENIKKLAMQIQDQPMTPLERAVWWTEYILRHKTGQHLKGPRIPFYQYYYLDVWAFLIVVLFSVVMGSYFVCKFTYNFVVGFSPRVISKFKKA